MSGADAETTRALVEELANAVLVDPEVVSLAAPLPLEPPASLRRRDEMAQFARHGSRRFATTATLAREAAVLEAVASGASAGVAIIAQQVIEQVLPASALGDDQRRAVAGLLSDGARVSLLVGPAGAGKSRALEAAQRAWSAFGARVVGLAPSAMAAAVLSEESGIASETLAEFFHWLNSTNPLRAGDVVVLDEAGMARTDDLARLVAAIEDANAKLVLVGDAHQLGAVGPGGLFRTLLGDHGAHEPETVRRFDETWEAAASLKLRARDSSVLLGYVRHNRISEGSRAAMADAAFTAWAEARARGEQLLVLAGDNATVDELARRCRAALVRAGEVERNGAQLASGVAGVGDEVATLRNDRRLRPSTEDFVRNGARWRVIDLHDDGALVVTALSSTGTVALPAAYAAEHVALAYALTIHKAQGATTDRAVVLVDEQMSAAQLYVGMTRGRFDNRALVVTGDEERDDHVRPVRRSGLEQLAAVMRNDGSDHSAHDVLRRELARSGDDALITGVRRAVEEQVTRAVGADLRRRIDQLAARDDRTAAERANEQARRTLEQASGCREAAEVARESVSSRRGWSPSRRAERSRLRGVAEESLGRARSGEARALRVFAASEHHLADARSPGSELDALGARQQRRDDYLNERPAEAAILAGRLRVDSDRAAAERTATTSPSPGLRQGADDARLRPTAPVVDIPVPAEEQRLRQTHPERRSEMTL